MMDEQIKGNMRYLKGLDGVPTIESGLIIDNTDGDECVKLPLLSSAECATVLNTEGEIAFDEQTHRIKIYDNDGVESLVSTADVDDTPVNGATTDPVSSNWAYDFINILTTQGDLPYATAAGTWTRLPKGTAGQYLWMNAGATAPEWTTGVMPSGIITIWAGTIASIPSGYVICDGNNGTPNLLAKFVEGVATAATNPGTTGGATQKQLAETADSSLDGGTTTPVVYYGASAPGSVMYARTGGGATAGFQTKNSITDIRPAYYDVAFIMKT
jgi:hypothetical protein